MAKRILLAGILGGIALFLWGGLSHMVLGLGAVGIQNLPQPQPLLDAMKALIPQPGFYFFPRVDASGNIPPEQVNGPRGILIYHPTGATTRMTGQLVNECILNIVQALIVAFLLSLVTGLGGYAPRVGFVALIGLLTGIATNIEYWNWYGFPATYTAGIVADKLIGFLVVGLVVAALVKPARAGISAVPAKAA